MKLNKFLALIFFIYSFQGLSKVKISDLSFSEKGDKGELKIEFKGEIKNEPIIILKKNILQVTLPSSIVWPKIEKKVSLGGKKYNTTLLAYQYNKDDVRVRILFPKIHNMKTNQIDLSKKPNELLIHFSTSNFSKKISSQIMRISFC